MCTLISYWDEHNLLLGINRDNPVDRRHGSWQVGEVLFPIDPVSGGTWVGASVHGRVAALLYGKSPLPGKQSRGDIVPLVLQKGRLPEPHRYGSFQLLVYDRGTVEYFVWDGCSFQEEQIKSPCVLASSRYGLAANRRDVLLPRVYDADPSVQTLQSLLRSHEPEKGTGSACMHGPHTETIASTIFSLSKDALVAYDCVGAPCENEYVLRELAQRSA